jgi:hypothetical protein
MRTNIAYAESAWPRSRRNSARNWSRRDARASVAIDTRTLRNELNS